MNNNTIELEHIKNKKKDANKMMEEMNAIWCDISEKEDLMLAKHAKLLKIEKEIEELQKKNTCARR